MHSYKQALHSAQTARSLAQKANFPFTRPADYFAEMVKSDSHMERIRQRLLDESAGMKRAEEKRKEREGKKFGKQVQLEKIKERQQNKKAVEERLKGLKRSEFPSPSPSVSPSSSLIPCLYAMRETFLTEPRFVMRRTKGRSGRRRRRRRGLRCRGRGRARRPSLEAYEGREWQAQAAARRAR